MLQKEDPAPPLSVSQWFNAEQPITLDAMRGRIVVIYAFQMLCPGCVAHGLPQAMKVSQTFSRHELVVLGLHSVFEHHDAMAPHALQAFLHEYRISFPVGVDRLAADNTIPSTMQDYRLRGTPSLIVIDRQGLLRLNHFGHLDDLPLGVLLGTLIAEPAPERASLAGAGDDETSLCPPGAENCDGQQCAIA